MEHIKKVSIQTIWQLGGKAVSALLGLFILTLITRSYGEDGTGVFTLAMTFLGFFYVFADFGFNAHFLPEFLKGDSGVFNRVLGLRIVWSLVLVLLAVALAPLLPVNNANFVRSVYIGALSIVFSAIFVTTNGIFQAKFKYLLSVTASSIGIIIGSVLAYYLIIKEFAISAILYSETLAWGLTALLALLFLSRIFKNIKPVVDLHFTKKAFGATWPISATLILNVVYFRADSFILSAVRPIADVGIYNLAYQIFQTVLVLPTFIMNGFYPIMIPLLHGSRANFVKILKQSSLIMLVLSILIGVVTYLIAPTLINLIVDNKGFGGSSFSLRLLAFSFPAFFVSSLLMWALVSLKKYKQILIIYVVGLIVNLILNFIFIPELSYIAASIITGISEYLILTLQVIILWRVL